MSGRGQEDTVIWYNNPDVARVVQEQMIRERTRRTHGLRLIGREQQV